MMTSNYLNCLKSHIPLSLLLTRRQLSLVRSPSPYPHPNLVCFSSFQIPTRSENPNGNKNLRKEGSLLALFKKCCDLRDVEQIHAHITQTGLDQNLFVVGKIIGFCAVSNRGSMDYAASVFEKIEKPDGFLWNNMIRGFVRTREVDKVFDYYKRMREDEGVADNFTFSFLLKVSGQLGSVMLGQQLHCSTLKHGLEDHVFVRNTLIHMYGILKDTKTAHYLFEEIPEPELVAWNTIIDCHVNCGKHKEALQLFLQMRESGVDPDDATLVVTLSACAAMSALDFGRWVHAFVDDTGFGGSLQVSNSLIDMYAKCGAVEAAHRTFNQMKHRNIVTWNTMISGLAAHGHASEALELFSFMLDGKFQSPDDVTFLGVLCACSHGGMVVEGRKYFNCMTRDYHIQPTIKHYGCMVDVLGRAGFVEEAYQLVRGMPIKCNAIVWRTLLAACRLHGKMELGEQVRRHLLELEPDHSSDYALMTNMYADVGQWNNVTRVRKSVSDRGVQKPSPGKASSEC